MNKWGEGQWEQQVQWQKVGRTRNIQEAVGSMGLEWKCKVSGNGERWAGVVSSARRGGLVRRDQIFGLEHKRTREPLRGRKQQSEGCQGDVLGLNGQEVHTG